MLLTDTCRWCDRPRSPVKGRVTCGHPVCRRKQDAAGRKARTPRYFPAWTPPDANAPDHEGRHTIMQAVNDALGVGLDESAAIARASHTTGESVAVVLSVWRSRER